MNRRRHDLGKSGKPVKSSVFLDGLIEVERQILVYTIANGANGNCPHAIPSGFSYQMKALHFDGIRDGAEPQFVRSRSDNSVSR